MSSIINIVTHLFESDGYDTVRRQPILSKINNFINSKTYIDIVSIAIKNKNNNDVITVSSIPLLIQIILNCIAFIDLGKTLSKNDLKYFIYGVLVKFILDEDASFFQEGLSQDGFQTLYSGIYSILEISPSILDISKSFCC
jgi:hypothetical protein